MAKEFVKIHGNIEADIPLDRIANQLTFQTESLIGLNKTEKTKQVVVEITIKEIKDVI